MNTIVYFPGGYDPAHASGNVAEQVVDNGDGTGTRTTYSADGALVEVEQLSGLPVDPPAPVDPVAIFDAAAAGTLSLAKLKAAYRASLVALLTE